MHPEKGIEIDCIHTGSQAEKSGLLPGDTLLSINSHRLHDPIDFMFFSSDASVEIEVKRNGKNILLHAIREEGKPFGADFKPPKPVICKNNCIFCFVNQLPKGLRKTLYIKDDDYRMSFLYGNYVTLTNLKEGDRKRIFEQRLSPLYISVHSTNKTLRNKLLGNTKAPDILKEIKYFVDNKIRLHAQVVLCPGYNDGNELRKTISDLYGFFPYVSSIAVVPVGLTIYRKNPITPVEKKEARDALKIIESFQKRFKKKHGESIVYGADELYIKSQAPFPPFKEYGDFPQIENGVGMVQHFMNRAKKIRLPKLPTRKKRFLTFTGTSFYPFLKKFIRYLETEGINIDIIPVENKFFGDSVTVTGLLTGKDIIRTLMDKVEEPEAILVPDVSLKEAENMFLDDISMKDMEDALKVPIKKIASTPEGLIEGITGRNS
jgi:putative radical SAM enzyme (TIGR03279 family)